MRKNGNRSGFSLLEVLIALGILTVGSTCVVALYSAAMETFRRSQVEFVVTHAAVEILNTAEDLVVNGAGKETLHREVKKRISLPGRYTFDLTPKEKQNGSIILELRVMAGKEGKVHTWTWRREVMRGTGTAVLPVSRQVPERYR